MGALCYIAVCLWVSTNEMLRADDTVPLMCGHYTLLMCGRYSPLMDTLMSLGYVNMGEIYVGHDQSHAYECSLVVRTAH